MSSAQARPQPWRRVHAIADAGRGALYRAFLRAADSVDADSLVLLFAHDNEQAALRRAEALAVEFAEALADAFPRPLFDMLVASGEAAFARDGTLITVAQSIGMAFDKTSPYAVQWASRHAAELVRDISEDTRRVLRQIVRQMFVKQIPPRDAARLVKDVIGLTERMAAQVSARLERGWSAADVRQYAARLVRQRAMMIARTESIRASNEGQRQAWAQAVQKGQLTGQELRTWIVTPDDRLCPTCSAMDGQQVGLNAPFQLPDGSTVQTPPAHPLCRCAQGLVRVPTPPVSPLKTTFDSVRVDNAQVYAVIDAELARIRQRFAGTRALRVRRLMLADLKGQLGTYSAADDTIRLSTHVGQLTGPVTVGRQAFNVDQSVAGAFRHELGHAFHARYVAGNARLRSRWNALAAQKQYISKYAATNADEYFAEAFSAFTHADYAPGMLPAPVERFLQRVLTRRLATKRPVGKGVFPALPAPKPLPHKDPVSLAGDFRGAWYRNVRANIKHLYTEYRRILSQLDMETLSAIQDYAGTGFRAINEALRQGQPTRLGELIQAALLKSPPPPVKRVWRGVNWTPPDGWRQGQVVQLSGLQSTSVDPMVVAHFGDSVLEIIEPTHGLYIAPLSGLPEEAEFLLPHGTKIRVLRVITDVDLPGGGWARHVILAEVVE
jgi:hypothetical protein